MATEEVGKELADTSFGAKILLTLGRVYEMQADIFLGGIIDGTVAGMRSRMHTLKTQMSAAGLAIKVTDTRILSSNGIADASKLHSMPECGIARQVQHI